MVNDIEKLEPGFLEVQGDTAYCAAAKSERLKLKDSLTQSSVTKALEEFVTSRIENRGAATHDSTSEGRSHFIFEFYFSDGSAILLHVPHPGGSSTSLKAEKITIEGSWMQYLFFNTFIPIPHVYCFSKDASDLLPILNLPFLLMDVVRDGRILSDYLSGLPELGSDKSLIKAYEQLALSYLQLRHITVARIGAIHKGTSEVWSVSKRLLTTDMYLQSERIPCYPSLPFSEDPYPSSWDYFQRVADDQTLILWDLRTLNVPRRLDKTGKTLKDRRGKDGIIDPEEVAKCAQLRFGARHGFVKLIDELYTNIDEYSHTLCVPFLPNFNPDKMFYNPGTGRITCVFNLEFTNFMPRPFLSDPPRWLVGLPPSYYIRKHELDVYIEKYEKALPKFLEAVKNVEARIEAAGGTEMVVPHPEDNKRLSTLMLESWNSKRFWFHYALEHIHEVDYLYYTVLYKLHPDGELYELTPFRKTELDEYISHSQAAVEECERDCKVLLEGPNALLKPKIRTT